MGNDNIPDVTHCVGCGLHCPVCNEKKFDFVLCENKKIVVWPEDNYFLTASLNNLLFKEFECQLPEGVIFVDFCIENILFFIDGNWLDKLKGFGMSIILVADRPMKAMARYWFNRNENVTAILVVGKGKEQFIQDAKKVLRGQKITPRGIVEVTEKEMQVLRMLAKGQAVSDIAKKSGMFDKEYL